MADSILTMFAFSNDDPMQAVRHFCAVMEYRNAHGGQYPTISEPVIAKPHWGRINGIARARSVPRAASETFIAELNDTTPPLMVLGEADNGYIPVRAWIYAPRLTVYE